ncbi:MAG TPA: pyruvate ferredoxin oxidoreductase [Methanomicrobia archaeon]|nr:pyruvate ferredoxin oxidoreductase [Methanomicrobia archaeon]
MVKKVIYGNHAVSYGARDSRVEVIAAYPITPQTQVVELLSEFCASGELKAKFIKVESEHSAMAACVGASAAGARAFTATSSQGLALMHEMLHWASNARHPIVMANINRAMGPPWSIWTDQNDSIAQRDTGWLQFYCSTNQEVYDTTIQAFKICENDKVLLPGMLILDAFVLSHTSEVVDMPPQEEIDEFLPPYEAKYKLDLDDPRAFGGLMFPDWYYELKYKQHRSMEKALKIIEDVGREFGERFGRYYGLVEEYRTDDAEIVLVVSSTVAQTSKEAVDLLRKEGMRIGLVRIRTFRPFPKEKIRKIASKVDMMIVIDRNISFGSEGVFYTETKAALYNEKSRPPVYGVIIGLGGRDVRVEDIMNIAKKGKNNKLEINKINWWGVKL